MGSGSSDVCCASTAHGVLVRVRRVRGTWVRAGDEMTSVNKSPDPPDSPKGGTRVGGTAGRKPRRSVTAQGCNCFLRKEASVMSLMPSCPHQWGRLRMEAMWRVVDVLGNLGATKSGDLPVRCKAPIHVGDVQRLDDVPDVLTRENAVGAGWSPEQPDSEERRSVGVWLQPEVTGTMQSK